MNIILRKTKITEKIIKFEKNVVIGKPRFLKYCIEQDTEKGKLILNLVTCEMVLVEKGEDATNYLIDNYFLVSEDFDDFEFCKEFRELYRILVNSNKKGYKHFTILTTTDCNARCFYCFEKNIKRENMDNKTANDVLDYIINNCKKNDINSISITWFGGEPLYNLDAINTICMGLDKAKINYTSSVVSNGYLFTPELVKQAIDLWHIRKTQVTLDGTREIYNLRKNYIYKNIDAYKTVINNIKLLADAKTKVIIRLNYDKNNYEDLLKLIKELGDEFTKDQREYISIYSHVIFNDSRPFMDEELEDLDRIQDLLDNKAIEYSMFSKYRIPSKIYFNACAASDLSSVVIMPNGELRSCDKIENNTSWGSIYTNNDKCTKCIRKYGTDEMISPLEYWQETIEYDRCKDCFYYPQCIFLKHCNEYPNFDCYRIRHHYMDKIKEAMINKFHIESLKDNKIVEYNNANH